MNWTGADPGSVDFGDGTVVVLDTGVLVACGLPDNEKYRSLASFAARVDARLVVPRRVYEELGETPDAYDGSGAVVDQAVEAGWLSVLEELDYSVENVSRAMDAVRGRIGSLSGRGPDDVEQADAALAGAAVQVSASGPVERVVVVTTDGPAGAAIQRILGDIEQVDRTVLDGFVFIDWLTDDLRQR